jgi:excisionase family DNA binding protein
VSRNEVLAHKKAVDLARAADYLGVSIQSVRRRIAEGALPAFRIGPRSIRVYVDDLEALKRPIGGAA